MRKELEIVKEQKIPPEKGDETALGEEPFDLKKELEKTPRLPPSSGIEALDEAFKKAFKLRPKKKK